MTEPRLSSATRSLLRAAKADAPNAAVRAKVWSSVAGALGGGAAGAGAAGATGGASSAPGALLTGATGASKMLALGTLLGGTVTVGLAAVLLHLGPSPSVAPRASSAPIAAFAPDPASPAAQPDPPPAVAPPAVPPAPPLPASTVASVVPVTLLRPTPGAPRLVTTTTPPAVRPPPPAPTASAVDDTLGQEASFVAEARGSLGRGDPRAALRAIHAARALPSHQLGPEELAVEAQALRALGREEQARDVDSTLKKQFPESALAH